MGLEPRREIHKQPGGWCAVSLSFLPAPSLRLLLSPCEVFILASLCSSLLFCLVEMATEPPMSSPFEVCEKQTHRKKCGTIMFMLSTWERGQIVWALPLNLFCPPHIHSALGGPERPGSHPKNRHSPWSGTPPTPPKCLPSQDSSLHPASRHGPLT